MNYRKKIAALMAFLGGSYFFLRFVLPDRVAGVDLQEHHSAISDGFIVVGAMTIGLGLLSLLFNHGGRLIAKRQGWQNSLALLVGLFLMLFISAKDWSIDYQTSSQTQAVFRLKSFAELINNDHNNGTTSNQQFISRTAPLADSLEKLIKDQQNYLDEIGFQALPATVSALEFQGEQSKILALLYSLKTCDTVQVCQAASTQLATALGAYANALRVASEALYKNSATKQLYRILFEGIFISLGSAIFSLLGFYIVTAAYRAFRVRSFESALMMSAALIVMLGQISVGLMLWADLSDIRLWLLEVPNSAAFRAIELGASVAGLVLAFRMWLSIESGSFSGKS